MLKQSGFKSKQKPLRRTSLKKSRNREEDKINKQQESKKDKEFYLHIWNNRPHVCYESGQYLGDEPLKTYFHHVLDKESYPEYRYEDWNIVLVSWTIHDQYHIDREQCPKIYGYYLELLDKHLNFEE